MNKAQFLHKIIYFLVGVLALGAVGTSLYYLSKEEPVVQDEYVYDPTFYDELRENEVTAPVTVEIAEGICAEARVQSALDSGTFDHSILAYRGREVREDGTYLTVMSTASPTIISVFDGEGELCVTGSYTYSESAPAVISIESAVDSYNPFQNDLVTPVTTSVLQSLPSYSRFTEYLKTTLTEEKLSEIEDKDAYYSILSDLASEAVQSGAIQ